ncbi:chitobiase/beta-hexosaminidase C-terminal domain-containing protein [Paenibacillus sp. F411]|uniref:chitobiase/beta-hexosaminidase C-terminal domain-containing protein n=1 Tax=Paenibacillus sp. F411 TaxID=2820239 RepID=UPI001AAE4AA5|nr:chitobiase/beta-hexosaminidase C-terminal domain-containing protein [Paenibacillus sp. F411]MBO2944548.1 chitobiase/beta-hexosaminidase C-terminal domain-containing protein [Paenibacillus sp. F411]
MKKWLSFLLLSLLCLTLGPLGSVAAKSSADFTDLKDLDAATKAKFDAMISAGVFEGVSESTFGLKEEMNRAQFAKVAALIFGLTVDKNVKTSSFSDVKADDPANGYALPYIEAIKAAGITDGVSSDRFNPAGEVTKEQLATFFVRGLDMKEEALSTPPVKDETVSDWAKSYVALALEKKLMVNGADGNFGGTVPAVRDLLVTSSYEAKNVYVQQVEEKQRLEEEKKQQEEKTVQPVPVQPPVIVSPPVVEPPVTVPPVPPVPVEPPVPTNPTVSTEPPVPVEPPVPTEPVTPPVPPVLEQAAMPTADIPEGTVAEETLITLTSATEGASIYYTKDGSTPTNQSMLYDAPISITEDVIIKAIAVKSPSQDSEMLTLVYTLDVMEDVVEDPDAPAFTSGYPRLGQGLPANSKNFHILLNVDKDSSVYFVVVDHQEMPLSPQQIINGNNHNDTNAIFSGQYPVSANQEVSIYTGHLPEYSTAYSIYLIASNGSGKFSIPVRLDVVTPPQP